MKMVMSFLLIAIFATSCASLSEDECKGAQWEHIGMNDGQRGVGENRYSQHFKACSEYGIVPDRNQYAAGIKKGLKLYCTSKGDQLGASGNLTTVPKNCHGMKSFKIARSAGLERFCLSRGESAGRAGNSSDHPSQCRKSKNYKKGFQTGLKSYCTYEMGISLGKVASSRNDHLCKSAAKKSFSTGYSDGVKTYCDKKHGFELGKKNLAGKSEVCPLNMKKDFISALSKGKEYMAVKKSISAVNAEINTTSQKMNAKGVSPDLRNHLQVEVMRKKDKIKAMEIKLYKIEGAVGI